MAATSARPTEHIGRRPTAPCGEFMARSTTHRLAGHQRRYRELAAQLADIGYITAGSITDRPRPPAAGRHAHLLRPQAARRRHHRLHPNAASSPGTAGPSPSCSPTSPPAPGPHRSRHPSPAFPSWPPRRMGGGETSCLTLGNAAIIHAGTCSVAHCPMSLSRCAPRPAPTLSTLAASAARPGRTGLAVVCGAGMGTAAVASVSAGFVAFSSSTCIAATSDLRIRSDRPTPRAASGSLL